MSDSRRSSRAKKTGKYSGFEAQDDSDDDFARSTPPPSKRSKLDKRDKSSKVAKIKPKAVTTECKEKETETSPTESPNGSGRGSRKERVSLDDKVFDREIQLALELSMQESQDSQTNQPATDKQTAGRRKDIQAQIHLADETASTNRSLDHTPSDDKENIAVRPAKPTTSSPEPGDEIVLVETLDEEEAAGGRRKRKAAKAAVARQQDMASEKSDGGEDGEEDFKADSGDDGSSDDYGAGDSDYEEFTSSRKRTKSAGKSKGKSSRSPPRSKKTKAEGRAKKSSGDKKSKPAPKVDKPTNSTPKAPAPVTPLARRPQAMVPSKGFMPPTVTGVKNSQHTNPRALPSPAVVRKPAWSSPPSSSETNPLGGVKLVSPGQPIRLGLSRNVRIKPLHPNAH